MCGSEGWASSGGSGETGEDGCIVGNGSAAVRAAERGRPVRLVGRAASVRVDTAPVHRVTLKSAPSLGMEDGFSGDHKAGPPVWEADRRAACPWAAIFPGRVTGWRWGVGCEPRATVQ